MACVVLVLAACGSTVHLDTPQHSPLTSPSAQPSGASTAQPGAALASAATSAALGPGAAPAADSEQPQAIGAPSITEQRLLAKADPDSYGSRRDAAELAEELAGQLSLDRQWVWAAISQARFQASVPKLMMPPPTPKAKNWGAYRSRFIEPKRVQAGLDFWKTHEEDLARAEKTYGVPAHIVVGVIGVETLYGRNMGRYRVLDTLTTLTLDFPSGRSDRSAYFKKELAAFLLLCREQNLDPTEPTGSFAGAMGWPQFMPSSQRKLAVDFDGDGRVDLTRSPVDAIGSVAHYLAEHGWQKGQATYFAVMPPEPSAALDTLLAPDIVPSFTPATMADNGASLSAAGRQHTGLLALVQLHNAGQVPTYVAGTANFYAITRYNQSSYYALAVAQLGETVQKERQRQNGRRGADD